MAARAVQSRPRIYLLVFRESRAFSGREPRYPGFSECQRGLSGQFCCGVNPLQDLLMCHGSCRVPRRVRKAVGQAAACSALNYVEHNEVAGALRRRIDLHHAAPKLTSIGIGCSRKGTKMHIHRQLIRGFLVGFPLTSVCGALRTQLIFMGRDTSGVDGVRGFRLWRTSQSSEQFARVSQEVRYAR